MAESRHVSQVYTVVSEAAAFEAVKRSRAVGDKEPITTGHLWEQVAKDMSDKPYKSLALDLVEAIERILVAAKGRRTVAEANPRQEASRSYAR